MKDTKDTKEKGKSVPLQIGKVTAPEYIIPLGPFHPALLEGEYFKLKVEGERVLEADPGNQVARHNLELIRGKDGQ